MDGFSIEKKNVRYRAAFASNYALDDNGTQFGSVESRHTVSDNGPKRCETLVSRFTGNKEVWREFDSRAPEAEAVFARRSTEPLYNRTLGR